ncbi:MAG: hypothetical protein QE271_14740 [Bacteriovoracaceae bacterium]|nr:hypothetical protein [Bacteriovoracaceae bacterium]
MKLIDMAIKFFAFLLFFVHISAYAQNNHFLSADQLLSNVTTYPGRPLEEGHGLEIKKITFINIAATRTTRSAEVQVELKFESNMCPFEGIVYETKANSTRFYYYTTNPDDVIQYDQGRLACAMWGGDSYGKFIVNFSIEARTKRALKKLIRSQVILKHTIKFTKNEYHTLKAIYSEDGEWIVGR